MDRGGILCKILEVYKTCGIDSFPVNSIEVIQTLGIATLDKGKQYKQQQNGLSTLPKVPPGKEKGGIFA